MAMRWFRRWNCNETDTHFRYRVVPIAGEEKIDEVALKEKGPNFLYDELPQKLPAKVTLMAQLAEEGDEGDDATMNLLDSRKIVDLGEVKVEKVDKIKDAREAEED